MLTEQMQMHQEVHMIKVRQRRISLEKATRMVSRAEEKYIHKKDFLDRGIEPAIRPVVIALTAYCFRAQNSCEGHLEGNLYPWVRLEPGNGKRLKTKKAVLRHAARIHEEIELINKLLSEFYKELRPTPDRELQVSTDWDYPHLSDAEMADKYLEVRAHRFVAPPGYFLQCAGAEMLQNMPSEIIGLHRKKILKNRQEDMLNFSKFLVSKL